MFFKRPAADHRPDPERSRSGGAIGSPAVGATAGAASTAAAPALPDSERALGLVIDALGGVLSALSRFPLSTPDRPADEVSRELEKWQEHATLGLPLEARDFGRSLPVTERDWSGVVRAVSEQRRTEHQHVESSISDLRDALWLCVESVHNAVKVDHVTERTTEAQMDRAKQALKRMQTSSIKQEILGAVLAIESALQTRREQQEEQYVSLATKLDRLGKQLEEARRESTTDPLTGLGNRKLFDVMAPRAIQMFSLSRQPVALLMIDLDKLKLVNDLYGHQAGDHAIVNLSKALAKVFLRQSDVLCRLGGDEFAVILPNTDWKMAQTLGRRLQEQLAQLPAPHPALEFAVSASVGVAQLDVQEELQEWVARADQALYRAKQNGRDRCVVANGAVAA